MAPAQSRADYFLNLNVNGYFNGGCGSCAPAVFDQDSYQLADDLDMVRGRHHISVGVDWIRYQFNYRNNVVANGTFTFNGGASGDALADFLFDFLTQAHKPRSRRSTRSCGVRMNISTR